MKPELNKWYYEEEYYSDVSNRKCLYYFTEDNPEDYIFLCKYITKIVYDDGTSSTSIHENFNAIDRDFSGLVPCDNPEEIYNKFVNSYHKLFKK